MPAEKPKIELIQVSKRYESVDAVHPIDLAIPSGKTTVLIGQSGCGKTTLLKLMMGLVRTDSGRIEIDGQVLTPETYGTIRRLMGYVVQGGGLFPHMTARENVTFMARYMGWETSRIDDRLSHLVSLTHFPPDGLTRYPGQVSGGQRQRVALMRALMLDPDVLLLDEPLGALDPMIRRKLQDDLTQIFAGLAKTVVMVTHDLGEAAVFADTVVLMREGRIVQQGPPRELLDAPVDPFVTAFVNAQRSNTGRWGEAGV